MQPPKYGYANDSHQPEAGIGVEKPNFRSWPEVDAEKGDLGSLSRVGETNRGCFQPDLGNERRSNQEPRLGVS
jgi:hypothetical protein